MFGWFSIKFTNKFVFPDPELQLLIFCMDALEYMTNFYLCLVFIVISIVIKVDHFYISF